MYNVLSSLCLAMCYPVLPWDFTRKSLTLEVILFCTSRTMMKTPHFFTDGEMILIKQAIISCHPTAFGAYNSFPLWLFVETSLLGRFQNPIPFSCNTVEKAKHNKNRVDCFNDIPENYMLVEFG